MKNKLIFPLFVLALLAGQYRADAQQEKRTPQISTRFGIAGSPSVAGEYFTSNTNPYSYGTLSSIYYGGIGAVSTPGTFVGGIDIKFNRVIALSVDLGVNAMWADTYSNANKTVTGKQTGVALYFMPKAKLFYMDREMVRMYGTVGVGIGRYFGYPTKYSSNFSSPFKLEAQFVPFGIEVGRKLFGFAELGVGTMFLGFHAGIGYKF